MAKRYGRSQKLLLLQDPQEEHIKGTCTACLVQHGTITNHTTSTTTPHIGHKQITPQSTTCDTASTTHDTAPPQDQELKQQESQHTYYITPPTEDAEQPTHHTAGTPCHTRHNKHHTTHHQHDMPSREHNTAQHRESHTPTRHGTQQPSHYILHCCSATLSHPRMARNSTNFQLRLKHQCKCNSKYCNRFIGVSNLVYSKHRKKTATASKRVKKPII